jgi:filamentous hemagglutinin family protein
VPCLAATNCASYGQATVALPAANTLAINQTSANAILNWASFNIASGYKVNILQPSASSQLLNNIWSADPSVIAGNLSANGQVYLYSQNGIIFDKGAQINVGSLTATTLNFAPVSGQSDPDRLFEAGILSNQVGGNPEGTPAFQAANGPGGTPYAGVVTVNPGATLTAASGGRIMLLGSAVSNAGSINTPNGQTILAAGNQVYLAASSDASLRGLLIEVNASGLGSTVTDPVTQQTSTVGSVTNAAGGTIRADTGNITLAGLVVNQAGRVTATTSVSENGSIYLVAGDVSAPNPASSTVPLPFFSASEPGFGGLLPNKGGTLTLAPGSVTEILPSTSDNPGDKATISEANLASGSFIPSQVYLVGQTVALQGDALVHAPGGTVGINAAGNPYLQFTAPTDVLADGGMIYLDSPSTIDVSGESNVAVAATRNIIQVTLESNDLQNDPLLRTGFLHGQAVTINANTGSTLFNDAPYVGNIGIGIDEVLTAGGNINLNSDGAVVTRAGSTLNLSGGSVAFQGGVGASTTKLQAANGKTYDISSAPNNVQYVGLANGYSATDPTWGGTTTDTPQTYYPGYLQGNHAGSLSIQGPQVFLAGTLEAGATAGPYQRTVASGAQGSPLSSATVVPAGGAIVIGCASCGVGSDRDFHAPAVTFVDGATDTLGAFDYTAPNPDLPTTLTLSPTQLGEAGFSRISVYSNGVVSLPAGSALNLPADGALTINTDASIALGGAIRGPGAVVDIETKPVRDGDTVSHDIALGAGVVIDVSGAWVNDSPLINTGPPTAPIATAGGSITLSAYGNLGVGAGSTLDVSGGGWVNSAGKVAGGAAGALKLAASFRDPQLFPDDPYAGTLSLGPGVQLNGDSLLTGTGSLALASGSVTVGTTALGTPGELLLAPEFFTNKGFSSYSIVGQNSVTIGGAQQGGTVTVAPVQQTWLLTGDAVAEPTGARLAGFTESTVLPVWQRSPASISFGTTAALTGTGVPDSGNLLLGANAAIITDPGASVTLTAAGDSANIDVLGRIIAPAGNILVQLEGPGYTVNPAGAGYIPDQQIFVGPGAVLDASGYSEVNTANALGLRSGNVLAGGTISLLAYKGFVVTDPTSTLKVSGVADTVDISGTGAYAPATVAASAGSIVIDAREGLVLQGALDGQAANVPGAAGGSLSLGIDLSNYTNTLFADQSSAVATPLPLTPRVLTLSDQSPAMLYGAGQSPALTSGTALISTPLLSAGGFDNLALKSADAIAVDGAVALATKASLVLDAPLLQGSAGSTAQLHSAYVALGNYNNLADYFNNGNPTAAIVTAPGCAVAGPCGATLSVDAQLIDIRGKSAFAGFSSETLTSSGDIRLASAQNPYGLTNAADFSGVLNASGALTLAAAQVYPTTFTAFTLTSDRSVTIAPATGKSVTPLSAGGSLTIEAPSILQEGVLRAPLGQITLEGLDTVDTAGVTTPGSVTLASGSLTSVSADGTVIPYGSTVNGQQWTYAPSSGVTSVVTLPPAKAISLGGSIVSIAGASNGAASAAVDLSGGGDLLAFEWIAGPGGSRDVLNPAAGVYQYAIVPSLGSSFAPIDSQYLWQQGTLPKSVASTPNTTAQDIYLSGVPGLPAGYYALLPARYALLPGAFAVDIVKTNSDLPAGAATRQPDGSYVVAGRLAVAGTDVIDSRTSTVIVAPNSVVNAAAQYTDSLANAFFSSAATAAKAATPALPADAGELELAATTSLALNGRISFETGSFSAGTSSSGAPVTQNGAGGIVSIQAPNLQIVDSGTPVPPTPSNGVLQLDAQSLDNLGAQSLILGAVAQNSAAGVQLNVAVTQSIEASNTRVALTAPEVILAAQNTVTLDDNAQVLARGTLNTAPTAFVLNGAGVLLSASTATTLPVIDTLAGKTPPTGTLAVGHGAQVGSTTGSGGSATPAGSLLLYSTGDTTAEPDANLSALGLGLYSSRVSVGDVPTGAAAPGGLNLTAQLLGTLKNATQLTLGSGSSIDFYGPVAIGASGGAGTPLQALTLNTPAINGFDAGSAGNVALSAGTVTLENTTTAAAAQGTGTGVLTVNATGQGAATAGQLTLGAGAKRIGGFGRVELNASGLIEGQGSAASLTVANASGAPVQLGLTAAAITAASGSDQAISTAGNVTITRVAPGGVAAPTAPLGGALSIDASSIAQDGSILLPAGVVALHATSGDLTLGPTSVTSAAGVDKNFQVTDFAVPAGAITLAADHGNISLAPGALVDVSGAAASNGAAGGNAGSLTVSAPQGTFAFAGAALKGGAPAGAAAGNFSLDESTGLANGGLGVLTDALQSGGLTGAVSLRTRGDAAVALTNTAANPGGVTAASFSLTVDGGALDVAGTVNTSGGGPLNTGGGALSLWAGETLTLEPTGRLLADAGSPGPLGINGTALPEHGGNVTLGSASAGLILNGGEISMLGNGGAATDGILTLRAPRTSNQLGVDIQLPAAGATVDVETHKPLVVEGVQTYVASALGDPSLGSLDITQGGNAGTPYGDALVFVGNGNGAALAAALQTGFSNTLGAANPVQVQVRPGIEVDAPRSNGNNGDLIVGDANTTVWDLYSWGQALGAPVNVTLRAAGNLIFDASLSDGFQQGGRNGIPGWTFMGGGAGGGSSLYGVTGSYRLTAGADLASADPLAVVPQTLASSGAAEAAAEAGLYLVAPHSGNVIVTPGILIRTGDGNIDLAAGGDVLLGLNASANPSPGEPTYAYDSFGNLNIPAPTAPLSSAVYTAGIPSELSASQSALFQLTTGGGRSGYTASFGYDGGNLSVSAAVDVQSAPSSEVPTAWLYRRGALQKDPTTGVLTLKGPTFNTAWGIEFGNFTQGFGVLGGGNLQLAAGGSVVNTSAVVASTGRLLGATGDVPSNANLVVTGGGALAVAAGGDIASGVFEDEWGNASIAAGGRLTTGTTLAGELDAKGQAAVLPSEQSQAVYPALFVGNGSFSVSARDGTTISLVANSTSVSPAAGNIPGGTAYFYTYAPTDSLHVSSAGGNVVLLNTEGDLPLVSDNPAYIANNSLDAPAYPATVTVAAPSGNIDVAGSGLNLFPSATGNLKVLANGFITNTTSQPVALDLTNSVTLIVNETDPSLWSNPSYTRAGIINPGEQNSGVSAQSSLPAVPLHQNDTQPIDVVALTGSISPSQMVFPKAANVIAGGTLYDLTYTGKNLNPADVTLIGAGGDIRYSTPTVPVTNALETNDAGITLAGPGNLIVLAGHSIDLGDSNGIQTTGSLNDFRLASTGAGVVAGAGFGNAADGSLRQPGYQNFINTYLAPSKDGTPSPYAGKLASYLQGLNPTLYSNLSAADALRDFEGLATAQQLPLLAAVLSAELSATGLAHTQTGASYQRGYDAINSLFPVTDANGNALTYSGNLDMFFSQIKTEEGGDVNLLVPGGSVVVGVPNPPASLAAEKVPVGTAPPAAFLGVLVLGSGAIQGFANQDFDVNTSRILTLEGGNIILWASNGNIDAGKGAKSVSAAPPPVVQYNSKTNLFSLNVSNDVVGSGIGQLLSGPGETAGLVNLIAPKGDVNAGDAGIRVAGNLNIAAVQVIGAGNITVAGSSSGVPASEAGAFAGALSGANSLGDTTKNALEQLTDSVGNAANYQQLSDSLTPAFITVKMFCLGIQCEAN